jgi:hypothetical protein
LRCLKNGVCAGMCCYREQECQGAAKRFAKGVMFHVNEHKAAVLRIN